MSNKQDLLKKIKQLASQGFLGEKANAELMLKKLMKKYNITSADLDDEILIYTKINVKRGYMQKNLLYQIIANSLPTLKRKNHFQKNAIYVELTKSEEREIRAKYDFYSKRFTAGLDIYFHAFIHKNKLTFNGPQEEPNPAKEIDKEKSSQILKMMNSLNEHQFNKQITSKSLSS